MFTTLHRLNPQQIDNLPDHYIIVPNTRGSFEKGKEKRKRKRGGGESIDGGKGRISER